MTQFDRMAENLLTILPSPNPPKDQRQEDKGDDLASLDSVYDARDFPDCFLSRGFADGV